MSFSRTYKPLISLLLFLVTALCFYWFSQYHYYRIDLTKDGRYSLSENTHHFIKNITDDYNAEIYLSGELPYGFHQLQKATIELITELNNATSKQITYTIPEIDTQNPQQVQQLSQRGLQYTSVNIKDKEGRLTQQLLFPALVLHNTEKEVVIPLLKNNPALSGQENLNQSIAGLEYEITNGLRMLERKTLPLVGFLEGQDELTAAQTIDFAKSLAENYEIKRLEAKNIDDALSALIIAQPRKDFSEEDKFAIDQYIMKGGKVLWLIDEVAVSKDSLRAKQIATAFYKPLNIEDQLFTYGIRINPKLVLDMNGDLVKVNTATKGEQPRFTALPWAYEPLLETNPFHPITKGLSPVRAIFANSIDTVTTKNIEKTPLLRTSSATRLENVPRIIEMREIQYMQQTAFYTASNTNVAVLLEGKFPSVFKGRLTYTKRQNFKAQSVFNKMIVIADGNIIQNEVRGTGETMQFLPLGYNGDYQYTHGNKTFLLNAIDYLCDDEGWLALRNKEYTPALLNKSKSRTERTFWQFLNTLLPLFLTFSVAAIYAVFRRRKYGK